MKRDPQKIGSYMTQVKGKLWYVYQAQSVHSKVDLQWLGICGGSLWKRFWIPRLASVIQLYFGSVLRFTVNFNSFCLAVSLINSLYSVPGSSFACSMGVVLPFLTKANSKQIYHTNLLRSFWPHQKLISFAANEFESIIILSDSYPGFVLLWYVGRPEVECHQLLPLYITRVWCLAENRVGIAYWCGSPIPYLLLNSTTIIVLRDILLDMNTRPCEGFALLDIQNYHYSPVLACTIPMNIDGNMKLAISDVTFWVVRCLRVRRVVVVGNLSNN